MSPLAVMLILLAVAFWLSTIAIIAMYMFRKLQLQERLAAIERGADLSFDPEATASRTRRSGIVFIAAGIGMSIADLIVAWAARDTQALVGQSFAVIAMAVGLGLLVDFRINRRELAARRGGDR